jgi:predicted metal-dependent hydrolase
MSKDSISVRHLNVDLSQGFERYWNGGDPYRTHIFNALSMMFPLGEQAFIDSVRSFVPALEAQGRTELLEDVKLFIGQEATHRHQHKQFNDQVVKQGYDSWVERHLEVSIAFGQSHVSNLTNLAFTVAYEHFTAVLGDGLLRNPKWTQGMPPALRQLWQWHAAEEAEHKAVAFDVYRAVGGGGLRRGLVFAVVFFEFFILAHIQCFKMLKQDRKLRSWRTWWSACTLWWGRQGVGWHLFPRLAHFLKPGFHPWQDNNLDLLAQWRANSADQYRVMGAESAP